MKNQIEKLLANEVANWNLYIMTEVMKLILVNASKKGLKEIVDNISDFLYEIDAKHGVYIEFIDLEKSNENKRN